MRLGDLVVDTTPLRQSKEFRYLFIARLVSLFGFGLTTVAIPVQIYDLTGSSLQVSLVSVVIMVPMLAGTLAGGVLADRMDRRRLILLARGSAVLVFALLSLNALLDPAQLWVIYLCAALNSVLNGLSATALMAATPAIVGRDQLASAGALMAITAELGAIIGPSLGGGLTAAFGLAANYALTGVATLVTTSLVALIRPLPPTGPVDESPLRSIGEGLRFVARSRIIAGLLLIDVCVALFTMPFALFPEIAERVFAGGPEVVGLLYAAPAVGAMIAAAASGWTGRVRHTGRYLVAATVACGIAVGLFGLSAGALWLALTALAMLGAADTVSEILRRSLLQHNTPDHLQGRVSSLWLAQTNIAPALGNFEAGVLARLIGPVTAVAVGGALCVVSAGAVGAAMPSLRNASLHDPSADELAEDTARP
ncbi:enterobactin transporter EntS [Actinosynnema sp. NPDC047251]|uniref:Putative MFS-type transporter n=1 Tax=Saccharothrix espanaensis (strain ATCC 51144 / DSM 44229 / JCM 9112 / NBRC 15066 / NRRL 15764) TaxID=1179773 RepID=K0JZA4_SACES|nr:enterobactin transporter EntS [Saccharothrix espanaensis]CCH30004.1 putative MFS-type transporter [Saccharothrix espanaensis DSM 44229]